MGFDDGFGEFVRGSSGSADGERFTEVWGAHMHHVLDDEFQDGVSAGSLVRARRCWLDLLAADSETLPQLFTFVFQCPTQKLAVALMDCLRYTNFAGYVRVEGRDDFPTHQWRVTGTTMASVWSLAALEHLFMRLRRAGSRYESTLVLLELQPMT